MSDNNHAPTSAHSLKSEVPSPKLETDPGPNVITMDGQPLPTPSTTELEQKRKVMQRAAEIIFGSFERDSLKLEKTAMLGEHTIQRRHELMDTARCLRVAMTWMMGPQANPVDPIESKTEPPMIITK